MVDCMNVAASAAATAKIVPSGSWQRRLFRAIAPLPPLAVLALSPALAQDFTVHSGDVVGQQILNTIGGVGIIEAGGVVSTNGALAVQMLDANQVVENFGLIETTGLIAVGIGSTGPTATITNSGAISTTGDFAIGIHSNGATATITNRGTISTTGFAAAGINDLYVVAASKIALQRARSPAVRAFARRMVEAHTGAIAKLKKTIRYNNVNAALPGAVDTRRRVMLDDLRGARAENFDHRYIAQQIAAHKETGILMRRYAKVGKINAMRDFAAASGKAEAGHLALAQATDPRGR